MRHCQLQAPQFCMGARAAALPAHRKQRMHQSHKTTKMPCSSSFVGIQAASAEVQQMQQRRSKWSKEPSLAKVIWGFPKIGGTFSGVPILRIIICWGLYWGPPILGNYHLARGKQGKKLGAGRNKVCPGEGSWTYFEKGRTRRTLQCLCGLMARTAFSRAASTSSQCI